MYTAVTKQELLKICLKKTKTKTIKQTNKENLICPILL